MNNLESTVGSLSLEFVEGLLSDYLRDPDSVSPDWRNYFDEMKHGSAGEMIVAHAGNGHSDGNGYRQRNGGDGASVSQIGPSFRPSSLFSPPRVIPQAPPQRAVAKPAAPVA